LLLFSRCVGGVVISIVKGRCVFYEIFLTIDMR